MTDIRWAGHSYMWEDSARRMDKREFYLYATITRILLTKNDSGRISALVFHHMFNLKTVMICNCKIRYDCRVCIYEAKNRHRSDIFLCPRNVLEKKFCPPIVEVTQHTSL